jgi:hypothetical protein
VRPGEKVPYRADRMVLLGSARGDEHTSDPIESFSVRDRDKENSDD